MSSNLLEAEVRAVLAREQVQEDPARLLAGLSYVFPDRPLTGEFCRVLAARLVRGADLWHLACALYLDPGSNELHFLTLDHRQRDAARAVGFSCPL